MDIRQRIINLAAALRKQFPERDGAYAIVMTSQPRPLFDERFQGDTTEDNRPDFVKKDDEGWTRIKP